MYCRVLSRFVCARQTATYLHSIYDVRSIRTKVGIAWRMADVTTVTKLCFLFKFTHEYLVTGDERRKKTFFFHLFHSRKFVFLPSKNHSCVYVYVCLPTCLWAHNNITRSTMSHSVHETIHMRTVSASRIELNLSGFECRERKKE